DLHHRCGLHGDNRTGRFRGVCDGGRGDGEGAGCGARGEEACRGDDAAGRGEGDGGVGTAGDGGVELLRLRREQRDVSGREGDAHVRVDRDIRGGGFRGVGDGFRRDREAACVGAG